MKHPGLGNCRIWLLTLFMGLGVVCFFASGCASSKDAFKGTPVAVVTREGLNTAGAETLQSLRKDPSIEAFVSQHGIPNYLMKKEDRLFLVYTQTNLVYAFEKSLLERTYRLLYSKSIPSDIRNALSFEDQASIEINLPLYRASP